MDNRIDFRPNVPQRVALKYSAGINRSHPTFGPFVIYTLIDGRTMALSPKVSESITQLGVKAGEPFEIEKCSEPAGQHSWRVARLDLDSELLETARKGVYGVAPAPVNPLRPFTPIVPPAASPGLPDARNGGSNGPHGKPVGSGKVPIDVAFGEILDWLNRELDARGEVWEPRTKAAMISTVLIGQSARLDRWQR